MSYYVMPGIQTIGNDYLYYIMSHFIPEVLFKDTSAPKVVVPELDVFQQTLQNAFHMSLDRDDRPSLQKICRCGTACLVLPYDIQTFSFVLYYLEMLERYFVIIIAPSESNNLSKHFCPKAKSKKKLTQRGLREHIRDLDNKLQVFKNAEENVSRYIKQLKLAEAKLITDKKENYSIYFHVIARYAEGYESAENTVIGCMGGSFGGILVPVKLKGAQ